jgi:hypothetical protein
VQGHQADRVVALEVVGLRVERDRLEVLGDARAARAARAAVRAAEFGDRIEQLVDVPRAIVVLLRRLETVP